MVLTFIAFCGLFFSSVTNSHAQDLNQDSIDIGNIPETHWVKPKSSLQQNYEKSSSSENTNPDDVIREAVFHSESLDITQGVNHINFDLELDQERLRFLIADRDTSSFGQVFAVELLRHIHAEISLGSKVFYVRNISGIVVLAKLPLVPDDIVLRELTLNLEEQLATVKARTIWSVIELVARSNVELQTVESLEWYSPLFRNLSNIFRSIRF